MHTLERNVVDKSRSEVDSVMTTVETRVQDAVLSAIEDLVLPRVELAMKSINASSGRDADSVVPDPDWRDFSGNIEGLQMTTSSRFNSNSDLNRIDENRGSIAVEGGDLLVNERNFERQTNRHSSQPLSEID